MLSIMSVSPSPIINVIMLYLLHYVVKLVQLFYLELSNVDVVLIVFVLMKLNTYLGRFGKYMKIWLYLF